MVLAVVPRPDVGDGEDTSARQRVLIWQDAIGAIAGPRIAIGYGPETQMLALEPRYPVELALRFENARWDRAHNLVLDTLLTTGLFGLAALAVLLYAVVRTAVRESADERGPGRWLVGGLLGAVAANLTANLFAFETAATGVLFWMVAGLLVSPAIPTLPAAAPARQPTARERRQQRQQAGGLRRPCGSGRPRCWRRARLGWRWCPG